MNKYKNFSVNLMKIISIKKIFKIIDSCTNIEQLNTCKNIADLYTKMSSFNGVINYESIRETLYDRINSKRNEIEYILTINKNAQTISIPLYSKNYEYEYV